MPYTMCGSFGSPFLGSWAREMELWRKICDSRLSRQTTSIMRSHPVVPAPSKLWLRECLDEPPMSQVLDTGMRKSHQPFSPHAFGFATKTPRPQAFRRTVLGDSPVMATTLTQSPQKFPARYGDFSWVLPGSWPCDLGRKAGRKDNQGQI